MTHNGVSFDVNVGAISVSNIGSEIGQRLEDALGNQFGRDHHVAGVVRYSAKTPFGIMGGLHSVPFEKGCGQNFKERAMELWPAMFGGGGVGGGMCGAGVTASTEIVGFREIYGTATSCVPGACVSQQYVRGYEPIYGTVVHTQEDSITC